MSLIWADIPDRSLGVYGADDNLLTDGLYASWNGELVDDPDPNISVGKVMLLDGSGTRLARWILPATRTTVGMGCRVNISNIPTQTNREPEVHQYRNASNNALCTIVISTTGSIQVMQGTREGTLLAESAQDVISANAWRHIESEVFLNATTGTVKVWVEGVLVVDANTLSTSSEGLPCAQVAFQMDADNTNARTPTHLKDIFIRDDQGSVNNSQIGTVTVYYRPPTSDVSSGWTPSTGTDDWDLLDDSPPNDATYISADDTPPAASIMETDSLPADVVSIRGIISLARSLKTDAGDGNIQVSLSPNGTDWDTGGDYSVTTSEAYYHDVSEVSPTTGVAWTPIEFASLQIRLDRTV